MENRNWNQGSVEMSVVCSDLSLLENINTLLRENGVIAVEDDYGILHYIVDGRNNRKEAAGKVTAISSRKSTTSDQNKECERRFTSFIALKYILFLTKKSCIRTYLGVSDLKKKILKSGFLPSKGLQSSGAERHKTLIIIL